MKSLFAFLIVGLLIGIMIPATYAYDTGPPVTVSTDIEEAETTHDYVNVVRTVINSVERGVIVLGPGDTQTVSLDVPEKYTCSGNYASYYKLLFAGSDSYSNTNTLSVNTNFNCKYFKGRCTYY